MNPWWGGGGRISLTRGARPTFKAGPRLGHRRKPGRKTGGKAKEIRKESVSIIQASEKLRPKKMEESAFPKAAASLAARGGGGLGSIYNEE